MTGAMTQAAPGASAHGATRVGVVGMWIFLATDAMGFGGLLIAYGVLRMRSEAWPDAAGRLALAPAAAMTFALLASSLTITLAARAEAGARLRWLLATLALGLGFLAGGAFEYTHLASRMGFSADLFASSFYAITGYHGLHVLVGVVALAVMAARAGERQGVAVLALYWHFVDLAWMPIFTFFYLVRP